MASTVQIDLRYVARGLPFTLKQVQAVVELLDDGNTVPFITRYRKDQTGGLDEEQIRQVQSRLGKERQLAERKQTILRSIESQGKLTEDLEKHILAAGTTKRLEDLYLPYKPKKQTLGTAARGRGLESLAREIFGAAPACNDLDARATDFVNTDRGVTSAADALLGAGHILAEQFSERAELRQRLREVLQRTGRFVTNRIGGLPKASPDPAETTPRDEQSSPEVPDAAGGEPETAPQPEIAHDQAAGCGDAPKDPSKDPPEDPPTSAEADVADAEPVSDVPATESHVGESPYTPEDAGDEQSAPPIGDTPPPEAAESAEAKSEQTATAGDPVERSGDPVEQSSHPVEQAAEPVEESVKPVEEPAADSAASPPSADPSPASPRPPKPAKVKPAAKKISKKELRQKKAEESRIKAFHDYFDYREDIRKIPPHRVLAINRGERAKVLRVKIECHLDAMHAVLDELLVPADHPHADYLRGCARDALSRLILPALERDARRELTDRAEAHAVSVFAKNLRNLLLQPPIRGRRVLAVDPGFKSGCKLAALDQFGNLLEHAVIYLVGKAERRARAKQKVVEMIGRYELSVVAIGNGTACRDVESFFAELLGGELKDAAVSYVIVNEAGASVYSTSRIGREEFPEYDASLRGAISIGRRLLDPLSELVKIDAANIGVGLYQHDVKAKHLRESLDEVVESCVNYVGVDLNTASPALLRYVSGLNQLTARRLYEYRRSYGPFRSREQLKEVAGFGDATFVQAAGFLKIAGGPNPLDATWIHPESYPTATEVLARLGTAPDGLAGGQAQVGLAERIAAVDAEAMAAELNVGALTLQDILAHLVRPGRDPREDLPEPVFKKGVLKLEDLSPGMEITGTVLNVVDFGCFVDIGMHDSGLVHVSRMADRFVRDPHEVVAVGDVVKVWVLEVNKERRRVSLSMIQPGVQRPRHGRHEDGSKTEKEGGEKSGRPPRRGARSGSPRGGAAAAPADTRRQRSRRPPREQTPHHRRDRGRLDYEKPSRKPPPPITDGMKAGKEPLRSFGDLMQFYEQQHDDQTKDRPPREKKRKGKSPTSPAEEKSGEATTEVSAAPVEKSPVEQPPDASPAPPTGDPGAELPPQPAEGNGIEPPPAELPERNEQKDDHGIPKAAREGD